ncbi:MAG: hypothetical protein ACOY5R_01255 [Pseudomonadota bacterium]|jgi:hypothetical protein
MRVTITSNDLQSIKDYLHSSLPGHRPSHRIEAAARGLGFTTYGGLREALAAGPIMAEADDVLFCRLLDVPFERERDYGRHVSRAIMRLHLHRVLDARPNLTQRGFDSAWLGNSSEMALPLSERRALLAERRQEAYDSNWGIDQFELAMIYLSRQKKIKSFNQRIGSYGLKHRAENLQRVYEMFEPLGDYVSNGMLIAAAYAQGFEVKPIGHDNYNARLNISMATVNQSRGRVSRTGAEDPRLVTALYSDLDRLAA